MSWEVVASEGLAVPTVSADATGRGCLVAVVDTGVNFGHPHVRAPARGAWVVWEDGALAVRESGFVDRVGHGTCCAALIRLLAPEAELMAVRVTGDRASTDADRLAHGIRLAAARGAGIISVSMGTKTRLGADLQDAVDEVRARGAVLVAANPEPGVLPAGCLGAIAAEHRDGVDVERSEGRFFAEGRARPAQGFSGNFWGASLATARLAAALARFAEGSSLTGPELQSGFSKMLEVG